MERNFHKEHGSYVLELLQKSSASYLDIEATVSVCKCRNCGWGEYLMVPQAPRVFWACCSAIGHPFLCHSSSGRLAHLMPSMFVTTIWRALWAQSYFAECWCWARSVSAPPAAPMRERGAASLHWCCFPKAGAVLQHRRQSADTRHS